MKSITNYLNSMKSMYFMLLACVALSTGVTSCNQDEFENYEPGAKREFTKAELIDQALKRIPQTRANGERDIIATMVTIKDTIIIKCSVNDTVTIHGEGKPPRQLTKNQNSPQRITFSDNQPSHYVTIMGKEESLNDLGLDDAGLILLEIVSKNVNLTSLYCANNHLDEIDWSQLPNLRYVGVSNNELSSIDATDLHQLESFDASNNRLTKISFSQHPYMYELFVENNKLTNLDLSGITDLYMLTAQNNPLKTINLEECEMLGYLDISSTPITTLDLSHNTNLWELNLANTSIEILNNQSFCETSFAILKELENLNVANTSFDLLDLSSNPRLYMLDISGSAVTRVNLSNNPIMGWLYATRSELTDLIGEKERLGNLVEVRIESTPLEKNSTKMIDLVCNFLPNRENQYPGHLYTYSVCVNDLLKYTQSKNWLINQ